MAPPFALRRRSGRIRKAVLGDGERPTKRSKKEPEEEVAEVAGSTDEDSCAFSDSDSSSEEEEGDILEYLPTDLLVKVFFGGYFDTLEVVRTMSCVCKKLSNLAKTHVNLLDLRRIDLEPEDVLSICTRFPALKTLDLSYCEFFDCDCLVHLKSLSLLKKLNLRGTSVGDRGLIAYLGKPSGKKLLLEELDLGAIAAHQSENIGDASVRLIAQKCPFLINLNIGWHRRVTNKSVVAIAPKLKHLRSLDLSLTGIDARACLHLAKMTTLEHLDLSACPRMGNAGLENLFKNKKKSPSSMLQSLGFRFQRGITSLKVLIHSAPQLKRLNIQHCDFNEADAREEFETLNDRNVEILRDALPPVDHESDEDSYFGG